MRISFCSILFAIAFLSAGVTAQNELDLSFNGTGFLIASLGVDASSTDVVVQPDRKVIVVGTCPPASQSKICAARYNENGSIDTSFGVSGLMQTALSPSDSSYAAALQPDGKIVVAGATVTSSPGNAMIQTSLVLLRYHSNGDLDTSFGTGGSVKVAVGPHNFNNPSCLTLQPDGKILVAGTSTLNVGNPPQGALQAQGFVARYFADGTLDTSFAVGGFYRLTMDNLMYAQSIALQSDGKILVGGGKRFTGFLGSSLVFRLNTDGSADTSWGDNGIFKVDTIENAFFISLAVLRDGRVLGATLNNKMYRFTPNGTLDTAFNGTGVRSSVLPSGRPTAVLPLAGGRIAVAGTQIVSFVGFLLSRYNADGSLDTTFSGDGHHFFQPNLFLNNYTSGAAVDNHGRIVVSGYTYDTSNHPGVSFIVARYLAAPPVPVTISGRVTRANGMPVSNQTVSLAFHGATFATARTNPFGYYTFYNVMTGSEYTAQIKSRGYSFTPQDIFVADDVTDLDFVEVTSVTKGESIRGAIK